MSEHTQGAPSASGWSRMTAALLVVAGCAADPSTESGPRNGGAVNPGALAGRTGGAPSGSSGTGGAGFLGDNPTGRPMEAPMVVTNPLFDPSCASTNVRANRILPTVMLVVDGSTSMEMPYGEAAPPPDGGVAMAGMAAPAAAPSRWMSIRGALVDPTNGVVPKLQGLVKFGMALFGTQPSCPLPFGIIEPVLNNATAITAGLPNGMAPGVFTPTGPALDMVVDHLPDSSNVPPDEPPIGPQIILLATDGDPNACEGSLFAPPVTDYAPSIAAAMKAQAKHIKMYVIGVGMDAAATHLQEMANIGQGMPQTMNPGAEVFYPENAAALSDTLAALIGAELSCDLQLDGKGIRKDLACMGTVTLDNMPLVCDDPNGWTLIDETHMRLQGTACDVYKNAADAHLTADFPCEVILAI